MHLRHLCLTVVVGLAVLAAPAVSSAADFQPHIVVSVAPYDELKADLRYIGKLLGNPQLADGLEGLLLIQTRGQILIALDRTRRWGVALELAPEAQIVPGEMPEIATGVIVLPIANFNAFLRAIEGFGGPPTELQKGMYQVSGPGGEAVYIRSLRGWVAISPDQAVFDRLPDDVGALVGGAGSRYDIAFQMNFAAWPPELQEQWVAATKQQLRDGLVQAPEESDEAFLVRTQIMEQVIRVIEDGYSEIDQIVLGVSIDRNQRLAAVDWAVTARKGSVAERLLAQVSGMPSRWAHWMELNPTLSGTFSGKIGSHVVDEVQRALEDVRGRVLEEVDQRVAPSTAVEIRPLLNSLFDATAEILGQPEWDFASAAWLGPEHRALVLAARAREVTSVNRLLQNIAGALEKVDGLKAVVEPDVAETAGMVIHRITLTVPKDMDNREQIVTWLGQEQVELAAAVGNNMVLLAAGVNTVELLQKLATPPAPAAQRQAQLPAQRQPRQPTPPQPTVQQRQAPAAPAPAKEPAQEAGKLASFTVDLANLMELLSKAGQVSDEDAQTLATALRELGEPARVGLSLTTIPYGLQFRIELGEGFLKVIPRLQQLQGGQLPLPVPGQAAPFAPPAPPAPGVPGGIPIMPFAPQR